jgi:hypothetical protein
MTAQNPTSGDDSDRPMIAVGQQPGGPGSLVFVTWSLISPERQIRPGVWLAVSSDDGASWRRLRVSTDRGFGASVAVGVHPGEAFVAWHATNKLDRRIKVARIRVGEDGKPHRDPARTVAQTRATFDVGVPAACARKANVYTSLAVDRSQSFARGRVYVAWHDGSDAQGGLGSQCRAARLSRVHVAWSLDGNPRWRELAYPAPPQTDQFLPWLAVDSMSGGLRIAHYESEGQLRLRARAVSRWSGDAGGTWSAVQHLWPASDESSASGTGPGAEQYGDYLGIAAAGGMAWAAWTAQEPGGGPGHAYVSFVPAPGSPPAVHHGR